MLYCAFGLFYSSSDQRKFISLHTAQMSFKLSLTTEKEFPSSSLLLPKLKQQLVTYPHGFSAIVMPVSHNRYLTQAKEVENLTFIKH